MPTQLRLAHLIVLASAGSAAFYGASRLATSDAADALAEPVLRADSGRAGRASAEALPAESNGTKTAHAEAAPAESVSSTPPQKEAAASGDSAQVAIAQAEAASGESAQAESAPAEAARRAPPAAGARLRAPIEISRTANAFPSVTWTPPPPPPAPPAAPPPPPPPPSAPSLPFRFVGMMEQKTDRPTAFLAKGEALHIVQVGDVVDSLYRVESLSPTQIVVTYLPLNQRQSLSVDGGQK